MREKSVNVNEYQLAMAGVGQDVLFLRHDDHLAVRYSAGKQMEGDAVLVRFPQAGEQVQGYDSGGFLLDPFQLIPNVGGGD